MKKFYWLIIINFVFLFSFCNKSFAQDNECPKFDFACRAKKCSADDLSCLAQAYSPLLDNYCNKETWTYYLREDETQTHELSWSEFKYNKVSFYFGRVFDLFGNRYSNYRDTILIKNVLVYSGELEKQVNGQNLIFQYSCMVNIDQEIENKFEIKRAISIKLKNNTIDFVSPH